MSQRRRWSALLIWSALLCVCPMAGLPPRAHAQESGEEEAQNKPYRLDLLDVTASDRDSREITPRLTDLLDRAEGLSYQAGAFERALRANGLTPEDLRSGDDRDKHRAVIEESLDEANLEGLLLIDSYSGGRKLQVLGIGPEGSPVHEVKRKLRQRRRLRDAAAKQVLREVFAKLIPAIKARRAEIAERKRREAEERRRRQEAEEARQRAQTQAKAGASSGGEVSSTMERGSTGGGRLGSTLAVSAGAMAGQRTFRLESDSVLVDQQVPLLGGALELRAAKGLGEGHLQLGVDADLAWAPFGIAFDDPALGAGILSGDFVRGGGALRVAWAPIDVLYLGARVGADVLSITMDPNTTYTGHRYIWGRGGAELGVMPIEALTIAAQASALPVLQAVTSGDAYGAGDSGLAFEFGGRADVALESGLVVRLSYRYTPLDLSYQADAATSSDRLHTGMLTAGWSF